jgi:hypothetical protein
VCEKWFSSPGGTVITARAYRGKEDIAYFRRYWNVSDIKEDSNAKEAIQG